MPRTAPQTRALYAAACGAPPPRALILRWPWWWRGFRGLTLGPLVLVADPDDPVLVCHELCHVRQFQRQPLSFAARYLWELYRVGYRRNRYEREARAVGEAVRALIADASSRGTAGAARGSPASTRT